MTKRVDRVKDARERAMTDRLTAIAVGLASLLALMLAGRYL
jgi:hypothetical protein